MISNDSFLGELIISFLGSMGGGGGLGGLNQIKQPHVADFFLCTPWSCDVEERK